MRNAGYDGNDGERGYNRRSGRYDRNDGKRDLGRGNGRQVDHEAGEHRTWPVTTVDHGGNLLSGVEAASWNHLVQTALRLLLPMECPGSKNS